MRTWSVMSTRNCSRPLNIWRIVIDADSTRTCGQIRYHMCYSCSDTIESMSLIQGAGQRCISSLVLRYAILSDSRHIQGDTAAVVVHTALHRAGQQRTSPWMMPSTICLISLPRTSYIIVSTPRWSSAALLWGGRQPEPAAVWRKR